MTGYVPLPLQRCALCRSHSDNVRHSSYLGVSILQCTSWITRGKHYHAGKFSADTLRDIKRQIKERKPVGKTANIIITRVQQTEIQVDDSFTGFDDLTDEQLIEIENRQNDDAETLSFVVEVDGVRS